MWGLNPSPVNSPHKGQWCGALMLSLICAWINLWVNNHEAGDLRCHHAHYDVTVMTIYIEKRGIVVLGKYPYVSHFILAVIGYGIYKWYAFHSTIHFFNWHIQLLKEAVHIGFQSLHLECYNNFKIGLYDTVLCEAFDRVSCWKFLWWILASGDANRFSWQPPNLLTSDKNFKPFFQNDLIWNVT